MYFGLLLLEQGTQYFAGAAYLHLRIPIELGLPSAHSPIDKPAESPGFELPSRAVLPAFGGAVLQDPARFHLPFLFHGKQKKDLPFRVSRNGSPPLLIALNCLRRRSQQNCHLGLRLAQPHARMRKLFFIHIFPGELLVITAVTVCLYHNVVRMDKLAFSCPKPGSAGEFQTRTIEPLFVLGRYANSDNISLVSALQRNLGNKGLVFLLGSLAGRPE